MWFDDVAVPWNRVFLTEPSPEPVARWLFWHQLYCWLAKAEFTLGLALACTQAMGLAAHEPTLEYLLDLITDVQTVRSCQTATELDPEFTAEGYCSPNHGHLAAGSLAMLKARRRMAEILRILPGSSLVVAPTDRDLADPALAGGLEESFAGGGYSARATGGPAADGVGPCRIGARSSRACLRAACQRRRIRLARPVAPALRPLQRAGQRRPAGPQRGDAGDQPRLDPQRAAGGTAAGEPGSGGGPAWPRAPAGPRRGSERSPRASRGRRRC